MGTLPTSLGQQSQTKPPVLQQGVSWLGSQAESLLLGAPPPGGCLQGDAVRHLGKRSPQRLRGLFRCLPGSDRGNSPKQEGSVSLSQVPGLHWAPQAAWPGEGFW